MADRHLVLMRPDEAGAAGDLLPLGTLEELRTAFGAFNTFEDGSEARTSGMVILHGPGMVIEIPTFSDEIKQAMVTVKDEELAFCVLWRLCRKQEWKIADPESGQMFG